MITTLKTLKHRIQAMLILKKEHRHAIVGPANLWEMKRGFQFQFLKKMNLTPEHYLCDIGCGSLRGGIPLISYLQDSHYYGIEVRKEALNEAQKELREECLENKKPILVHCEDISHLIINQKFDYIWAFSVLIHMSDNILDHTLDFVNKHLSKDGAFYANVNIGTRSNGNWQGFPVIWRTFDFYEKKCFRRGLIITDIGSLRDHEHITNIELQDTQRMLKITKNL